MHIEIGKYYVNKTWRFLLPCLRGHGDTFVRKFNPIFKLAVGIHDTLVDGAEISKGRSIYILCDKLTQERLFKEFIEWIRCQEYFVADYCPDSEILSSRKHMVIINVPRMFNDAYDNFLLGNYSIMYLDSELKALFSSPDRKKELNILTRNPAIVSDFVKQVNEEFQTSVTEKDFKMSELELPLKKKEEIFNCKKNNQNVFFNETQDKVWEI